MPSADSIRLLQALRSDALDEKGTAMRQVFERYYQRLWRLAWQQMHPRIRQRIDPDDVINSGLKSLFLDFQAGKEYLEDKESLWGLLAGVVLTKVCQAAREHRAHKRDAFREQGGPADDSADPVWDYLYTAEPTPHDALCLKEAIENLSDELQAVAVGKLHGRTDEELAQQLGYKSTETIRLAKRRIEKKWRVHLEPT